MPDLEALQRAVLLNSGGALAFIALAGLVPEPWRRRGNVALLCVAGGLYLGRGLGTWDIAIALVVAVLALAGSRSYRAIGVGWCVHTVSDVFHHGAGLPILQDTPLSSFGCAVFDPLIAVWFFFGAPSTGDIVRGLLGRGRTHHTPAAGLM